ncbi:MAG: NTP transferase domain-containing protein [Anaerolineae bacterium]|nr:NTP transferase domain-containing protein [Anaerolineae bacterium]NIN97774.1 NTP transferase domain-containing protein [Anaerolineae bacterium]NIQ80770.1 NTP transferase domain-containing protein [Anaerolineae bacterium]
MAQGGYAKPITSILLAGGRSARLGRDKAFLQVNGQLLIERILRRLGQVSEETIIVANEVDRYEQFEGIVIADVYPGKGALGGIFSGLKRAANHHSLVVACDMPFLNVSLLRYMQGLAADYDVVIPRVGGLTEALHAIYSKNCLPFMERQLQMGDLRIIRFFPQVRVRYVEQEEIEAFDPEHLSFFNINSQEDLDRARAIWPREESTPGIDETR